MDSRTTSNMAERLLMNEFKTLSKETWTNIEVRKSSATSKHERRSSFG